MATAEHNTPVTGLILAGGRSSRMGRDKAQLRWQGLTMLEHMRRQLAQAGARPVLVSGDRDGAIADRWPHAGPIGALTSVADALDDAELLIVPVDMPRLSAALLARLAANERAAAVHYADHVLPLRLRLDETTRQVLRALMARPPRERRLRALVQALHGVALPVPVDARPQLANANTPEQWQEMCA
ncbi:molybdenum cofactor guanylyltransferase [Oleiagrimonas sp. C23AA]|uniref:molybdenum cofactor guanylyltransferase n=1 Tax=Oleiagrimonas sp. C23AA TaxID=2719047 RepID=UPI0014210EE0|nr:molybdenum cofactor guanylyltransferase [Oleiagrimonas sp. C23AA]NII11234.1 molybdenum cofactor guanylyltransferase [Oleiagrimonas sp. C23AA]